MKFFSVRAEQEKRIDIQKDPPKAPHRRSSANSRNYRGARSANFPSNNRIRPSIAERVRRVGQSSSGPPTRRRTPSCQREYQSASRSAGTSQSSRANQITIPRLHARESIVGEPKIEDWHGEPGSQEASWCFSGGQGKGRSASGSVGARTSQSSRAGRVSGPRLSLNGSSVAEQEKLDLSECFMSARNDTSITSIDPNFDYVPIERRNVRRIDELPECD